MAPQSEHLVTSVLSTQVLSHDGSSVLVEAGGFNPMRWFLQNGLKEDYDDSDPEPPKKKLKTEDSRSATPIRAASWDDEGKQIPVARACIDLHFPETLHTPSAKPHAIARDVEFDEAEAILVWPSVKSLLEDGDRLSLQLARKKGLVITVDVPSLPVEILDAFRQHASLNLSERNKSQKRPAVDDHMPYHSRCTVARSRGQLYTVVRLEATLMWDDGASAFAAGVPMGKAKLYPHYEILLQAFPDHQRDEADHAEPWTPQDFYGSVHVPSKELEVRHDFQAVLESELYPFQKRAVHWMLEREGVEYNDGHIQRIPRADIQPAVSFLEQAEDMDGNTCYINHLQGIIQRDERSIYADNQLSGGLLAEEMGLGKTVELMALIRLHTRTETLQERIFDAESSSQITPSRATLIITPTSILQQWKSELAMHAPSLRVLVYEGISSISAKEEAQIFSDLTTNYDVVLATYHTLAREVHFAEDPPKRNMRHKPKFERKRSPLVRIQWWRIALDEAQMVESGVTAAARVACRLPRLHSWAVSGTPLRKNVQDLHGLLIFLRYRPLSNDAKLWSHLITNHKHIFRRIFGNIALRHTKAQIREDLDLPSQKRVVVTVPFSAIEEQHYHTLFTEMCHAVGVNEDGSPRSGDWDPEDPGTTEAMRSFLTRLRQTCLHPQVGGKNRRALGKGSGPLRTVAEVLEVMIDQKETSIRTEERALLASQLLRAHILGNAKEDEHRSEKSLRIYQDAMQTSVKFVKEARKRLADAREVAVAKDERDGGAATLDTDDEEDSSSETTPILGRLRNNLRTCLQLQHACTFFAATSYFQIKSNEALTAPDSEQFSALEQKEMALYEAAKVIRREILKESARKAESLMRKIQDLQKKNELTTIPKIKDLESLGGIESRRIVEKSDMLFDVIREQAMVIVEWRTKMAEYLLKPLVDEDEGIETTGDEYEDSTKLQDELYAYFDACKIMQADLNAVVSGEAAPLIDHEAKMLTRHAKTLLDKTISEEVKVAVHAPELTLELLDTRNKLREQQKDIGSVRGLIQEARGLETSLQGHETGTRAVERMLVRKHLSALQTVFATYTKTLEKLEKEVDLFRTTQNQRLEFYRQLQEVSDSVKPHKEELDEKLDLRALEVATQKEEDLSKSLAHLMTQNRYLLSLREETGAQTGPKICVICQFAFENGVLTVCGHQFCKECIQHWWSEKRSCPVCKRELRTVDFHNITYKPQELRAKEEVQSSSSSPSEPSSSPSSSSTANNQSASIYSDIDTKLLQEIKSIDLRVSYGTKIDTLGRHLHWLRAHDPGAKSIIFSQYREFLDVLGTALHDFKIGYARLGRAGAVEKFKREPSIDCLLLDAKTDSSGLTLVNATHVVLCEPLIQTAVELQAIARVHRIGQTRPTTVWMYLVNDTVEESIYEISVARRLAHVQSRQSHRAQQKSRSATPAPMALQENAIEVANSEELQSQPISKLLVAGKGGGEVVGNGDLWQCLFGKAKRDTDAAGGTRLEATVAVRKHWAGTDEAE